MDTDRTDAEHDRVRGMLDRSAAEDEHDPSVIPSTPTPTTTTTGQQQQQQQQVTGYPESDQLDPNIGETGVGELDLEMDVNIKQALQRVIEGFDHEPGDMSATLQQQEEYMRRTGRDQDEEQDVGGGSHGHDDDGDEHHHHLHQHPDEVEHHGHVHDHDHDHQDREHDDIQDVMAADGDRDNIFQHFAAIDDPHGHGQDRGQTPLHGLSSRGMGEDDENEHGQAHDQHHQHDHDPVQTQIQTHDPDPSTNPTHPRTSPSSHPKSTPHSPTSTTDKSRGTKRKRPIKVKAPIPPVDDDPSRPLTEEEIKRRQNRSRASGRVLPVSPRVLFLFHGSS